jgi:hypothetical protein
MKSVNDVPWLEHSTGIKEGFLGCSLVSVILDLCHLLNCLRRSRVVDSDILEINNEKICLWSIPDDLEIISELSFCLSASDMKEKILNI